jgi:hypothetical protein
MIFTSIHFEIAHPDDHQIQQSIAAGFAEASSA